MTKRLIFGLPVFAIMILLGACGMDTTGSDTATLQERINACEDELAACDGSSNDCESRAMGCMNSVNGNGTNESEITHDCDRLYSV
ncbi:MAG: hypothetical protein WBN29_01395, partial [Polyangiales bacterium]